MKAKGDKIKLALFRATNSLPRKTRYVSRHFRLSCFKANKANKVKVKAQGIFNMHIIFESMLMLFNHKLSKLVRACRNYSLPKLARFLRHNVLPAVEHAEVYKRCSATSETTDLRLYNEGRQLDSTGHGLQAQRHVND